MTEMERVKARAPDIPDALAAALLEDARDAILAYTERTELPAVLTGAQVQLAVVYYNRMGTEGETSHSEGGVSRGMESLPADIEAQIGPYRVRAARVVNMHAPARAR